ncbi:hypothetical protein GTQ40_16115 [Flavobacteriaceae bacterium R38]|nr:hypothetical protein [Flavobacteriaceae bacterium R38]
MDIIEHKANFFKLNKTDYRLIFHYFLLVIVFESIVFKIDDLSPILYINIPVIILGLFLMMALCKWVLDNYLKRRINLFLVICIGYSGLWVIGTMTNLIGEYTSLGYIPWDSYRNMSVGDLIVRNIENSIDNIGIPLFLISTKKYYDYLTDSLKLSNSKKELELKVLRSQFNPHFLYNSLNTVDALVDNYPKEKVKEYISNLAGLYRYLIKKKDEDVVLLEEEIELAKKYFYIIETRFENDYKFLIKEKALIDEKYLPTGALLTALENVVKHNEMEENKAVITEILITRSFVQIKNNISKSNSKIESFGSGLKNLKKRYELLSDEKIEVKNFDGQFVLTMPLLTIID